MELSKLEIDLIYPTFWGSIKENGIIQSGNGIIQTGNGIISLTSWAPMKKTSFTKCL